MSEHAQTVSVLTFEEAIKQLESIVERLETQDVPLEASLKLFQQGVALSDHCNAKLTQAQGVVKLLYKDRSGDLTEIPFDADDEEP